MNRPRVLWLLGLLLLLAVAAESRLQDTRELYRLSEADNEQPALNPEQQQQPYDRARFAQRGFFKTIGRGLKKVGGALLSGAKALIANRNSDVRTEDLKLGPIWQPMSPFHFRKTDIEDCVACQYVWYLVELEVGDDALEENIYDAFTQVCIDSQKAPIFFPACEHMFDQVYDMIGDYMDGKLNVNQMCIAAGFCRDPNPSPKPVRASTHKGVPVPMPVPLPIPPILPDPTPPHDDGGKKGSGGKKSGKKSKKSGKKSGKKGGKKSSKKGGKKDGKKNNKKSASKKPPPKIIIKIKKAFKTSVHFQNGYEKYRLFDYPTKTNKDVDGKPNPANHKEEQKAFPTQFAKFKKLYEAGGGKVDATIQLEFHLGGYASKVGDAQKNMVLSLNRARATACYLNAYLQKKGIVDFTFRIGYFGDTRSSGKSPAAQSRDRRVDIFFRENLTLKKKFREQQAWRSGSKNLKNYCANRSQWQNKAWMDSYLNL